MKQIEIPLVGLRYRVTPTTLRELEKLTPIAAKIEREFDNTHDLNAISVSLMERPHRNFQVGYVARDVAAELAPRIDEGRFNVIEVWVTEIDINDGSGQLRIKYSTTKPS